MLFISAIFVSSRLKVIMLATLLTMRAGSTALMSGSWAIHFFMDFMGMPQTSSQKSTLQSEKYSSCTAAHLKERVLGKMCPPFFRNRSLANMTSSKSPSKCRQYPIGQAIMASTLALKSFQSETSMSSCSRFSLMIIFIISTHCFSRSPFSWMTQQTLLAPALAAKMEQRQLMPSVMWRTVLPAKWSWFSMMTWQQTWWVRLSSMLPSRLLMERQLVWLMWGGYCRFSRALLTVTSFQSPESWCFWCRLLFFLWRDGCWFEDIGDNSQSNYIMMSIISNQAFHSSISCYCFFPNKHAISMHD